MAYFKYTYLVLWISIITSSSCTKKIDLKNFDANIFKNDKNGCKNSREAEYKKLEPIKSDFVGMRETQLYEILGQPDKQQIEARSKKQYFYYLNPSKVCDSSVLESKLLIVDFDALNRVVVLSVGFE